MRTWKIPLRITRTRRSDDGFYLLINGSRLWHPTLARARAAFQAFLSLQSFQILTVREYGRRRKHRGQVSKPPE
jgi:hypothetical protein